MKNILLVSLFAAGFFFTGSSQRTAEQAIRERDTRARLLENCLKSSSLKKYNAIKLDTYCRCISEVIVDNLTEAELWIIQPAQKNENYEELAKANAKINRLIQPCWKALNGVDFAY